MSDRDKPAPPENVEAHEPAGMPRRLHQRQLVSRLHGRPHSQSRRDDGRQATTCTASLKSHYADWNLKRSAMERELQSAAQHLERQLVAQHGAAVEEAVEEGGHAAVDVLVHLE